MPVYYLELCATFALLKVAGASWWVLPRAKGVRGNKLSLFTLPFIILGVPVALSSAFLYDGRVIEAAIMFGSELLAVLMTGRALSRYAEKRIKERAAVVRKSN
jgi:hypothetical protein